MSTPQQPVRFHRFRPSRIQEVEASVIVEAPVDFSVNGEHWLTFMCTPTDLPALGVGFLFNEGLIQSRSEIISIDVCSSADQLDIWLSHLVDKPIDWQRTSGCSGGVTSVAAADLLAAGSLSTLDTAVPDQPVPAQAVMDLMACFLERQDLYRQTRGVHSSALSNGVDILLQSEDIGRHNTLDKLAGKILLEGVRAPYKVLITTGRISSEMLQKAARMRAWLLISRTAPNSLSIQMAEQLGITLVGYARRSEFNVYAHPERVVLDLRNPE